MQFYLRCAVLVVIFYIDVCSMSKQNIVLLHIENINEVMKVLKLLDPENDGSKDVLGNIRKLYNESIQFHNVYGEVASASNFAALMTGKPAVDLGIIRGKMLPFDYFPSIASTGGLKTDEITLAEALKAHGYRTWFSGYWKLGLGRDGSGFPIKHGFDTWMGVAHPHDEWCRRKEVDDKREKNHPYMYLLYKISFWWSLGFLCLTTLVWLKFIGVKLFINLIIYTFSTSFAFYILLHLFMIQRSASCVLYYHDFIYQQPYEAKNLTLHFTQYTTKLIQLAASQRTPFFMVLNYLKMRPPFFHSNYFRKQSTNTWSSSLLELDWSIGEVIETLKEMNIYNDTIVITTGNNNCELNLQDTNLQDTDMVAYERYEKNRFRRVKVPANTLSNDCINLPLFIKDNEDDKSTVITSRVYEHVSVLDVFQTVLDLSQCDENKSYPNSFVRLYKKTHCIPELVNINNDDSSSEGAVRRLHNSFASVNNISYPLNIEQNEMIWIMESEDEDVTIETYVNNEEASKISCEQKDLFYNRHTCMFHYYNVHKPMAITYKGHYKIIYTNYIGSGYVEKLNAPIIIDLQNNNASQTELEAVYDNVTQLLDTHWLERQSRDTFTSEFEMPVYPWLMPCANFPRCETRGESGNVDFSRLSSVYDDE